MSKVKETLRKLSLHKAIDWFYLLGFASNSINKSPLIYKVSPEKVLYGQSLNNDWSPLKFEVLAQSPEKYYEKIKEITAKTQNILKQNKGKKSKENIGYLNNKKQKKRHSQKIKLYHTAI